MLVRTKALCERGEGVMEGTETSKAGTQQKLAKVDANEKQSECVVLKDGKYS